jgi:REP element-mobilizing transposase RayT
MPLIQQSQAYPAFYKWFDYLPTKHVQLIGYVIMPNHFHGILSFGAEARISLNALTANAKRFIAYEIIKLLEESNQHDLLWELYSSVTVSERERGKRHKVFKTSFDSVVINDVDVLHRILKYIHDNPCNKKWQLAASGDQYAYSSAGYYDNEVPDRFVFDHRKLF